MIHFLSSLKLNARAWRAKNKTLFERFEILRRIASIVVPEYRFKWPQLLWWENKSFFDYAKRYNEDQGNNLDRRWTVHQFLRLVEFIEGDTAEIGVYQGAMSHLILAANQGAKHHHLFDSFEGLSHPDGIDGDHWHAGDLACDEASVIHNLSRFKPNFTTHKGWVPDRFEDITHHQFCFVHIDVDIYQPTRDAIAFFYPRTNPGGIILCDDYGCTTCPGATKACDDYLADKPEKMIALPDGGGFFIKGIRTGQPAQVGNDEKNEPPFPG